MKKHTLIHRVLSVLLCTALLVGYIPAIKAAPMAQTAIAETVTDPGTADSYEHMMGTGIDGNRYAGRVWVDKSVYKDGDTVVLNSKGNENSSFPVELAEDEAFQIVFSALGSTMTTKKTISSSGPLDVVLILDDSTSMDDKIQGNTTRLEKLIQASNKLLANLTEMHDIRIGIVAYNANAMQILPFGTYENGVELRVRNNKYTFDENNRQDKGGTIQAFDKSGTLLYNNTSGYNRGTNTQSGINMGMGMLETADNTENRTPVAIVLTDGAANTAVQNTFYRIEGQTPRSIFTGTPAAVVLATLLNASYKRVKVEANYGKAPMIYGIGVDIDGDAAANAVINPGAAKDGFNERNSSSSITTAYRLYNEWLTGKNVERTETYNGSYKFTFDHGYSGATLAQIEENIHYVDTYYPVSSAELENTFQQIYEELASGVFNPISSSSFVSGGTGVDDTPLIYVDYIGQYMQVKKIQSVTLFGASYGVVKNADGSYTVTEATGTNPTTNERWNTAEDIRISVTEQADGIQKLEIRINQEILPIIMEQVISETVGDVSEATITEYAQDPMRVYYTVGVDSQILLPNSEVDISKLQGYPYIDDATGTVFFYSNRFGVENAADESGVVAKGDAHVGFRPSLENRYYYHQTNQGIFTRISDQNGKTVTISENNEYGIIWDEDKYRLSWMTYAEYQSAQPEDKVYTYVTYFRPTESAADAPNAAEEITYLVYTNWKYLKESVAFYDAAAKVYLYDGKAVPEAEVESVIAAYRAANPGADIYAVLGVDSRRTSRLHNMMVDKTDNPTQTAVERYTPEYLENKSQHNDNDVVVWLGNNGKLAVQIETGIALTKTTTEPFGNADDTYSLTLTVPAGVVATPVVVDESGNVVTSTYENNVLTVNVKAGQTVYVSGIPGGTECVVGENISGDYYIQSKTDTVRVPLVSEVLSGAAQFAPAVVTNAPYKYGNLFITKEITGDHAVPESILATEFTFTVNVGTALAGSTLTVEDSAHTEPYTVTVDPDGNLVFVLKARQTVEIFDLPVGTAVTVTEATPDSHFTVSYRSRNHSGEDADTDNAVIIPANGSATVVVLNDYTPAPVTVDLDAVIGKDFADASVADRLSGGVFTFLMEKYDAGVWQQLNTAAISYSAGEYGEKTVTVEDVLSGESYTRVGTYSYRISEVKGEVANVSYDRTVYTFDVIVTDQNGVLAATVVGGQNQALTDTNGDGSLDYITKFVNTYETAPISMDITKTVVNYSGDPAVTAQGFQFQSVSVDAEGNPLQVPENIIFSDAAGQARISGYYTREQIGTHYYIVYEEAGNQPGWTYSAAQYFVTVVVAEDAETGKLFATMTIEPRNEAAANEPAPTVTDNNKGQLHFTNIYDPENVSIDLDGSVFKELTGKTLEDNQFTFYVYKDGDRTSPVLVGTNKQDGNVHFVDFDKALVFTGVGKYQYDVVEHIPDGASYDEATGKYVLGGMYYDATIFDLVVEVVNDTETGKLIANTYFEDAVNNTVTFHNRYYTSPTEYALGGVKVLNGRAPRNGEFTFELYEGDNRIQTATNQADGSFRFEAIAYTKPGTYAYTIREQSGNVAGVSYDGVNQPVTVVVTVTDENGVLCASANLANENIKFENTYTANPAGVSFSGTKTLAGGTLVDGMFSFQLYKTDNTFDISGSSAVLLETTQNANGEFRFGRSFSETGTYFFVIVEDASAPVEGIVYDRSQHRFAVRVTDSGDGQLKAMVTNLSTGYSTGTAASVSTAVHFTNATFDETTEKEVYLAGDVTTEIDGKRVNAGDILTYFITYTNYTGENVVADIMDTIPNYTSYVEGTASHNGTYAGTHLNWILNVAKGESVTVSFNVRVNQSKVVVANTAVVRDGVNTYYTNEVVNHTVEEVLDKDVFSTEDLTVSINGKKVYAGDELLYQIGFTNTSGKPVDIVITDRIPEHTTYVDGSADNGGKFENGAVVWSLQSIPAWSSVTVTFKVTVNTGVGAVTIPNQATATDGVNSYETNVVTNYTVEDEVVKKVFAEDNTQINIDGKRVYAGEVLVYTITYKNTAEENANVTITDTIPQYTTYVDGSADNGGVFAENVITWTLDVEPGAAVTVSFKVKVNKTEAAAIRNQAAVVEGRNTYQTNEVTNTVSIPKDPSNPQTGDHSRIGLWMTLLFVCGGAVIVLMTCGEKKEETEQA